MKFYITTPIYYVNDKPHIGHAYTTVTADVIARYHRTLGDEVKLLTGTDEHGAKIMEAATKNGKSPKEFCDEQTVKFQKAWEALGIQYDHWMRTTYDYHERRAGIFLQKLFDKGLIYKGIYKGLYCVGCESYKTETDLVGGLCLDHKKAPVILEEENYFFKLSAFNGQLQELIEKGELIIAPESRRLEMLGLLKQGLNDIAISRKNVSWGIPLPWDPEQTAYVWIEALMNYATAVGLFEDPSSFAKWWPADVHLMAKDIVKFHALIWPAMLLGAGLPLPRMVYAHGFFTVDGSKMSKTLGNTIDPLELAAEYGADSMRYLLLSDFAFGEDGDISHSRFATRYKADLADGIGNLASRVAALSGKLGEWEIHYPSYSDFPIRVSGLWSLYHQKMKKFAFHEVLSDIRAFVTQCDQYVEETKPWELAKTNPDQLKEVLSNLLESLRHISLALAPFMPVISEKLLVQLGGKDLSRSEKWGSLSGKIQMAKLEPLFPRKELSLPKTN
ncbi:MAG: methionyl-tRNA synthetase [Parcubacteria group bacterium Gr01-1014_18]|nr:MAG: methionyl-tRNA synthetase [Parcubacteria group bacterium Greene0416_36]TSC81136.1 MAG: methionyl-tRNA synthetase [Parcubacteria group bacterium Gr01-1014_18]TSC98447.1 MAG: methionyl-tRNA synthetase [Parcubacteria group bacterium Greene1014_20]TSD07387.1 MAG: methionyl-tRNA synthetase [Parcubacteria group bacterium Greene0714_2]